MGMYTYVFEVEPAGVVVRRSWLEAIGAADSYFAGADWTPDGVGDDATVTLKSFIRSCLSGRKFIGYLRGLSRSSDDHPTGASFHCSTWVGILGAIARGADSELRLHYAVEFSDAAGVVVVNPNLVHVFSYEPLVGTLGITGHAGAPNIDDFAREHSCAACQDAAAARTGDVDTEEDCLPECDACAALDELDKHALKFDVERWVAFAHKHLLSDFVPRMVFPVLPFVSPAHAKLAKHYFHLSDAGCVAGDRSAMSAARSPE